MNNLAHKGINVWCNPKFLYRCGCIQTLHLPDNPKSNVDCPGKDANEKKTGNIRQMPLRGAVINAIFHRDYYSPGNVQIHIFDNRAQVWNP